MSVKNWMARALTRAENFVEANHEMVFVVTILVLVIAIGVFL